MTFNCPGSSENEEHVLLLSPVYNDLRDTLFTTLVHEFPDINDKTDRERLCEIFYCKQNTSIRTCAKPCFDILKLRRKSLYKQILSAILRQYMSVLRFLCNYVNMYI